MKNFHYRRSLQHLLTMGTFCLSESGSRCPIQDLDPQAHLDMSRVWIITNHFLPTSGSHNTVFIERRSKLSLNPFAEKLSQLWVRGGKGAPTPRIGEHVQPSSVADPWYGAGSVSADPCLWLTDPDPGSDPAIFVHDLQDANKKGFSAYFFLKVYLHHFLKIKSQKKSQNGRNQAFAYYFCFMIEGSGSVSLTYGSGSGRPKNIRIRNTAA